MTDLEKRAGGDEPEHELLEQLSDELGRAFDLSARIGGRTLAEAVLGRLRELRPGEPPQWGGPGEIAQVASERSGPLDFYYRPHLFPEMDPALRLGHQLQFSLLPRSLPASSPLKIAAVLESYCHLSGDLLGWRPAASDDGGLFLWIADVSGHGVRAGLAAAALYFLIGAIDPGTPPAEFARQLDRSMRTARNDADPAPLFATGFWLRVEPGGRAHYASSGHPSMLLRRADGTVERLPSSGPPLGLLPGGEHRQRELRLAAGDTLFLFTDGVSETTDERGEELGDERLTGLFERAAGTPLDKARSIYRALSEFRPTSQLEDDLTFLVVELA